MHWLFYLIAALIAGWTMDHILSGHGMEKPKKRL